MVSIAEKVEALERRVHELETERRPRALLARYGFYADHGRHQQQVNLFAEDGVFNTYIYAGE